MVESTGVWLKSGNPSYSMFETSNKFISVAERVAIHILFQVAPLSSFFFRLLSHSILHAHFSFFKRYMNNHQISKKKRQKKSGAVSSKKKKRKLKILVFPNYLKYANCCCATQNAKKNTLLFFSYYFAIFVIFVDSCHSSNPYRKWIWRNGKS